MSGSSETKQKRKLPLRRIAVTVIPWLHCTLLLAPVYAVLASIVYQNLLGETAGIGLQPGSVGTDYYFCRALALVIPIAALSYGAREFLKMWQYLLLALICAGGTFLISRCWIATAIVVLLAVIRLTARVREADTVLDAPMLPGLVIFLLTAIISGVRGDAFLQLVSLFLAAVYLVLVFAYRGLTRVEEYISLNRGMADFPERRIGFSGGLVFGLSSLLVLLVVVPTILLNFSFVAIDPELHLPSGPPVSPEEVFGEEETGDPMAGMGEGLREMFGDEIPEPSPLALFLEKVVFVVVPILLAAAVIYGLYTLSRQFSRTAVREQNDVIESILSPEDEERTAGGERRLSFLDFSPNAAIRRSYRKTIRAASGEKPRQWQTPAEIERGAGVENDLLHQLYEKARYSREGCTREEKKLLK